MKRLFYIALIAVSFASCKNKDTAGDTTSYIDTVSHAGPVDSSGMTTRSNPSITSDSTFLVTAHEVGVFEIAAAKVAHTHSTNAKVKEFADMMTTDHTALGKEVESMAAQKNVTLPLGPGDDLQKELDKLRSLKGKAFDKEYADVNVKGHKEAISTFTTASQNKDCSPEVQQLASNALPTLKAHKEHADMLKDQVKM